MAFENRYLVLKGADVDKYLNVNDRHTVNLVAGVIARKRKEEGKQAMHGIFIDSRWPIYAQCAVALQHMIDGNEGDPKLAYIRRLEKKLAEKEAEIHQLQGENAALIDQNNQLKKP